MVVFNHIYERVVDADAVLTEIHRVLKPAGVGFLGLGNKYQVMEPHYRLPFLSWLPQRAADRYAAVFGKADEHYESYASRKGLKTLVRGFHVWDYTIPVVLRPDRFESGDQVHGWITRLPPIAVRGDADHPYLHLGRDQVRQPARNDGGVDQTSPVTC